MFTVHAVELLFTYSHIHLFKNLNKSAVKEYHISLFCGETYGYEIQGGFFNWASPENVSRLAPPKNASTGPPPALEKF